MTQLYVSDVDLNVEGKNGVTAQFYAGQPRPLRPNLVELAEELGVKPADAAKIKPKTTRKAAAKKPVAKEAE